RHHCRVQLGRSGRVRNLLKAGYISHILSASSIGRSRNMLTQYLGSSLWRQYKVVGFAPYDRALVPRYYGSLLSCSRDTSSYLNFCSPFARLSWILETLDAFASPISKRGCISIRSEIAPALLASEGFFAALRSMSLRPTLIRDLSATWTTFPNWSSIGLKHLSSLVQSRYV